MPPIEQAHADRFSDARLIGDVVMRNARLWGDKAALVSEDGAVTSFAAFQDRVSRLAGAFTALGLVRGARVAIYSRNRPEYLEAICIAAAGFVAVPLNWRLHDDEIAHVLRDCRPDVLIADAAFASRADQFRAALGADPHHVCFDPPPTGWSSYEALLRLAAPRPLDERFDPDDTACIVYTSGTTGRPKGAELTHRALLANGVAAVDDVLHLGAADVTLAAMPFFHVGGLWYHLFPSFAAGCTTIVLPAFAPAPVLAAIERHRVTNLHLVPTMLHGLMEDAAFSATDLSSLRLVYYAASTIPSALLKRALQRLKGCGFVQGYGSTEAGMIAFLDEAAHRRALTAADERLLQSCGRSLRDAVVRLSDVRDGIGEIVVASPMTMKGYWENATASAAALRDGFLATGDLAKRDDEGFLYILDRRSDMIVTGGENVYPREIEDVLLADERISEIAVFDLPDERWVQMVVAAVVLKPGIAVDPDGLCDQARHRLAGYKCPKRFFIVEALPKNGAGKVLRKELRRLFAPSSQD